MADKKTKEDALPLWERVWTRGESDSWTSRLKVPGGWLYRHREVTDGGRGQVVFVPDPEEAREHQWALVQYLVSHLGR